RQVCPDGLGWCEHGGVPCRRVPQCCELGQGGAYSDSRTSGRRSLTCPVDWRNLLRALGRVRHLTGSISPNGIDTAKTIANYYAYATTGSTTSAAPMPYNAPRGHACSVQSTHAETCRE